MAIRHYKVALTAVGPLHIGNGDVYKSKDYFRLDDGRMGVLDARRFVGQLDPDELEEYVRFLSAGSSYSLHDFLGEHRGLASRASKCIAYEVDMTLSRARRGSYQYYDVLQFVKDAYGCPYVPGSSVKGMLRTALLTYIIMRDRPTYAALYDSETAQGKGSGSACRSIERRAFWQERPDAQDGRAANDIMRYVSVSDSTPLTAGDLVFAKKYDRFARADSGRHKRAMGSISRDDPSYYEGNSLNIYRECLKPGTHIELSLDIDERIDAYLGGLSLDSEGIASVLGASYALYKHCFLDCFDLSGVSGAADAGLGGATGSDDGTCQYVIQSGPLAGRRCRNRAVGGTCFCNTHRGQAAPTDKQITCCLGGGVDFDNKTVVNALFEDDEERVLEISRILYAQFSSRLDPSICGWLEDEIREAGFNPRRMNAQRWGNGRLRKAKDDHRHWKDAELGVSPHTLKLGVIGDRKHLMGKCTIEIKESR